MTDETTKQLEVETPESLVDESVVEETRAAPAWPEDAVYPSFYGRVIAVLLDGIILLWPLAMVITAVSNIIWSGPNLTTQDMQVINNTQGEQAVRLLLSEERVSRFFAEQVLFLLAAGLLWIAFWYRFSATPGKMLLGMKIVDGKTGAPPSVKQYIGRYIAFVPSLVLLGLGLLVSQWTSRGRAWHDMMVDTVVVKKSSLPEPQRSETPHLRRPAEVAE